MFHQMASQCPVKRYNSHDESNRKQRTVKTVRYKCDSAQFVVHDEENTYM